MIKNQSTYTRFDTLRNIIEDNNQLVVLLNRFDISLGFGDGTVEEVCRNNGVDMGTFLAVTNFIGGKKWDQYDISLLSLIGYLRKSHSRFMEFSLPNIKKTLIEGINEAKTSEISMVILRFYDAYMEEVKSHMDYEDAVIFSYVEKLINGTISKGFHISEFSSRHDHMAGKLDDLKELFIYKFKQKNNEMINTALLDLMLCGKELIQHCEIENHLLFPQVERLEQELRAKQEVCHEKKEAQLSSADNLTDREREVLREIAQGLSTKEIADKLCLSFHTVSTYRKNLGEKLNIHSATGMAVYAILHHIIDINDINIP